jgi:hypothetical protein
MNLIKPSSFDIYNRGEALVQRMFQEDKNGFYDYGARVSLDIHSKFLDAYGKRMERYQEGLAKVINRELQDGRRLSGLG